VGLIFIVADRLRSGRRSLRGVGARPCGRGVRTRQRQLLSAEAGAQIEATTTDGRIGLFVGQHWSQDVFDYYDWLCGTPCAVLQDAAPAACVISETKRAMHSLRHSPPFMQHQLMPFGSGMYEVPLDDWARRLRPA